MTGTPEKRDVVFREEMRKCVVSALFVALCHSWDNRKTWDQLSSYTFLVSYLEAVID